jgi:enoyl-CoA hydratase
VGIMGTLINYSTDRGVALLVLNDPPVNAYTHELVKELDDCITDARFDEDVHVIVVTGHGENAFCAGANISMLREVDPDFRSNFFQHAGEMLTRLEHTPKLVIAGLNGHAIGGGCELALACDLRIARSGAGTIGLPELKLGFLPGTGEAQRLARLIGKSRAMEMILESARPNFDVALHMGLVNYVWETPTAADFLDRVITYARRFTLPNTAVLAVGRLKRAIQASLEMSLEQALAFEWGLQAQLLRTDDVAEGLQAWVDKRSPVFQGR